MFHRQDGARNGEGGEVRGGHLSSCCLPEGGKTERKIENMKMYFYQYAMIKMIHSENKHEISHIFHTFVLSVH